ncbi:MAG: MATE family efflux transporter, partial [Oscillospiraceae bacterium]
MEIHQPDAQEERYLLMTQASIPPLICRLAVPTMISMLTTSIYNMADTYFVSQLSTSASGAVGIVFSLMAMIQAIGFTLGMGSGNFVARLLGQREQERAEQVAATGFYTAVGFGLLLAIFGTIFIDPLVRALGATETIYPYARDYTQYILLGAPYMAGSFVLNVQLRSQGSAFFSMIGIATGGVLNILLDPLFIFVFDMGTGGAALATILSQLVSFCILYYFSMGRNGNIGIKLRNVRMEWSILSEILRVGFPSLCRQGLASLAMVFLNRSAFPYGDAAIAAMSIVNRIMMMMSSLLIGFGQGFQPVCGFNYGAKRYDRVLQGFWFCVKVALVFTLTVSTLMFLAAPQVIIQFRREDLVV